jgi:lactate permease
LVAYFLGPEFPSLVGGLVGLSIVVPAAKAGWFMPSRDQAWDFPETEKWEAEWTGIPLETSPRHGRDLGMLNAWLPYVLVALLLVATRLKALPLVGWVKSAAIPIEGILGTEISRTVMPLYLPGSVFIIVSLLTFLLHRMDFGAYGKAWTRSAKTMIPASAALVFTVPMVQVFINSDGGAAGYEKMPLALAAGVEKLVGEAWPLFATFIGGIGASVAGSNTISNMMFSLFQFDVGTRIGVDPTWIVALQAVGGAAGNTICVHNVVAASAVVGLVGKEGVIIRKTLVVFTYYALLPGALGYAIVWSAEKGPINLGSVIVAAIVAAAVCMIAIGARQAYRRV